MGDNDYDDQAQNQDGVLITATQSYSELLLVCRFQCSRGGGGRGSRGRDKYPSY